MHYLVTEDHVSRSRVPDNTMSKLRDSIKDEKALFSTPPPAIMGPLHDSKVTDQGISILQLGSPMLKHETRKGKGIQIVTTSTSGTDGDSTTNTNFQFFSIVLALCLAILLVAIVRMRTEMGRFSRGEQRPLAKACADTILALRTI